MKSFKHIIIFTLLWLLLPQMIAISSITGRNLLLIGIPFIFFLYQVYKTIRYIIEGKLKIATACFINAILFISISIKIEYHYYNWLIHLILIIIGLYFLKPFDNIKTNEIKAIGLVLLIFNFIMLITPNSWILNNLNYDKMPWSTNLEWNDFKGLPDEQSKMAAIISTTMEYKVNKVYSYPSAVLSTYMIQSESWKKDLNDIEAQKELLNHEKGHFNIYEAHILFAKDSLQKVWGKSPNKIEEIIEYYIEQKEITQKKYDSITVHGSNLETQKEWDILIGKWLN